jgi:hypothetical protein
VEPIEQAALKIKSIETQRDNIVLTGMDKKAHKILGTLLNSLQRSERAYNENMATAKTKEGGEAQWWKMQAAVLVFRPDPSEWPGVDVLEAICQAEFGSGLTAENLQRIRGKLALASSPTNVDSMTIQQAVDGYRQLPTAGSNHAAKGEAPKDGAKLVFPLFFWLLLFFAITIVLVYCAWVWGQGDNLWQKILASGVYFALDLSICVGGFLLHSGRAGRQLVKRWKGEE